MGASQILLTYVTLWIVVLTLTYAVFQLFRYHGRAMLDILQKDGITEPGPRLNSRLTRPQLDSLQALGASIDGLTGAVIFFASTSCPACRVARTTLNSFVEQNDDLLFIAVCIAPGEASELHQSLHERISRINDPHAEVTKTWSVPSVPFLVGLDVDGYVRATGPFMDSPVLSDVASKIRLANEVRELRPFSGGLSATTTRIPAQRAARVDPDTTQRVE